MLTHKKKLRNRHSKIKELRKRRIKVIQYYRMRDFMNSHYDPITNTFTFTGVKITGGLVRQEALN